MTASSSPASVASPATGDVPAAPAGDGVGFPVRAAHAFPRAFRLLEPRDFDIGAQLGRGPATGDRWVFRRAGRLLTLTAWQRHVAAPEPAAADRPRKVVRPLPPAEPVRVGLTVGRKLARRAVDRNTVKRIVRESARMARAGLNEAAQRSRPAAVDVVVRLKAPWPRDGTVAQRAELRRTLRAEADGLFGTLRTALRPVIHT